MTVSHTVWWQTWNRFSVTVSHTSLYDVRVPCWQALKQLWASQQVDLGWNWVHPQWAARAGAAAQNRPAAARTSGAPTGILICGLLTGVTCRLTWRGWGMRKSRGLAVKWGKMGDLFTFRVRAVRTRNVN